jgi:hypothetical protein
MGAAARPVRRPGLTIGFPGREQSLRSTAKRARRNGLRSAIVILTTDKRLVRHRGTCALRGGTIVRTLLPAGCPPNAGRLGFDDELVRASQLEGVCFAEGGHLGQKPPRFARVSCSCNRLVVEARVAMLNENYTLPTPIIVVRIVATWRSSSPVPA